MATNEEILTLLKDTCSQDVLVLNLVTALEIAVGQRNASVRTAQNRDDLIRSCDLEINKILNGERTK